MDWQEDKIKLFKECLINIVTIFQWFESDKVEFKWGKVNVKAYKVQNILRIDIKKEDEK